MTPESFDADLARRDEAMDDGREFVVDTGRADEDEDEAEMIERMER